MKQGMRKTKTSNGDVPGADPELPRARANYARHFLLKKAGGDFTYTSIKI